METKIVLKEEEFNSLDSMLRGIAGKYNGWYGLKYEDLYQECWLKASEVINSSEELNLDLICRCCYNRVMDIVRYTTRRLNQIPMDPGDESNRPLYGNSAKLWNNSKTNFDINLILEEIENLFDEGSREREYIHELEVYFGVKDATKEAINSLFDFSSSRDNEIAWNLGYANSSSNGYRGLKWRVRCAVEEHFGEDLKF